MSDQGGAGRPGTEGLSDGAAGGTLLGGTSPPPPGEPEPIANGTPLIHDAQGGWMPDMAESRRLRREAQESLPRGPVLFRSRGWSVGQPRVDVIAPASGGGMIVEMCFEGGERLHTWLTDGECRAMVSVILDGL
jgi:hypothetical protein